MKRVTVYLSVLAILVTMTSCMTADYSILSSRSVITTAGSVNPALSMPDKGLHPYASGSFSHKSVIEDREDSIEGLRMGTLTVGVNYHKNLENSIRFTPFFGGSVSGSIVSYNPRFLKKEYEAIQSHSIAYDRDLIDYSVDVQGKTGLLIRLNKFLYSLYGIGICRYEDGAYASLRRKIDGIQRMYNVVDNPWSYGYGLGIDIQMGHARDFDFGLNMEAITMYNRIQSISSDYLDGDSDVPTKEEGDVFTFFSAAFSPYIDYRHMRVSVSFGFDDITTVSLAWRF